MSHVSVDIAGRECFVRADEAPRFLLVQTLGRHERAGFDRTADLVAAAVGAPVVLAAFQVFDWALDLMPWPDPAISRDPKVGTMAEDTLRYVTDALLPALEADYGRLPVILGGYSLGGLFALWAASQTDRFAAIAAASPSLWIRDWLDFAGSHPVRTGKVYLSLGDREEHAKNRAIARVGTMAEDTLRYVTDALLPALEADFGHLPVILGGYSLGGLFALWAASQTDRFAAIAAASPSLWIRDWLDFAGSHPVRTGKVYLSLGDREEHARNRAIARVGDSVRGEYELLQRQLGAQGCTLVWHPGGHFQDEDSRLAAAFGWCAAQLQQ